MMFTFYIKANVGHALETAVLHELHRQGAQVNYVRTLGGFDITFNRPKTGVPPPSIQMHLASD